MCIYIPINPASATPSPRALTAATLNMYVPALEKVPLGTVSVVSVPEVDITVPLLTLTRYI